MADQGQPLMTVPQTNLFGAAADDISSILANREVQKRKQMLEDLKTQMDLQKVNNETALAQNTVATGAQQRDIAGKKAPAELEHLGAETRNLNVEAGVKQAALEDRNALPQALKDWTDAMESGDPKRQEVSGARLASLGGKFVPPEVMKELRLQNGSQAIGTFMDKMHEAMTAGNVQDAVYWATKIKNAGGEAPTIDPTALQPVGNGTGAFNQMSGKVTPTGFTPPPPAGQQPVDQATVDGAYNMIKQTGTLTGVPTNVVRAVFAKANALGETVIPLTAQSRGMKELSDAQMPTFEKLAAAAQQMQALDLMGTVRGRYRNLLAGESLADPNASYTPEQRHAIGNFEGLSKLFTSGTMLAHFRGRSGPGTYEIMQWLNPAGKDFDTYMGDIEAARGVLENYSKMGGIVPSAGAGKGGGAGVQPTAGAVDPNNPLGLALPRIK